MKNSRNLKSVLPCILAYDRRVDFDVSSSVYDDNTKTEAKSKIKH